MSKKTILCVDDERDILLILETALSDDYKILTASSGADALAIAKKTPPDLFILDLMMPEMDGLQTFAEFKQVDQLSTIPCIFLTGVSDKEKIREALMLGTKYYLTKPFDLDELMEKVSQAIAGSEASF